MEEEGVEMGEWSQQGGWLGMEKEGTEMGEGSQQGAGLGVEKEGLETGAGAGSGAFAWTPSVEDAEGGLPGRLKGTMEEIGEQISRLFEGVKLDEGEEGDEEDWQGEEAEDEIVRDWLPEGAMEEKEGDPGVLGGPWYPGSS